MSGTTSSTMSARLAAIFPDSEAVATESAPPTRRPSVRAVGALAFVIAILIAAIVSGAFDSSGSGYRTAVATTKNVDAALSGVATIEPTLEATIAFPMSGTVASVGVKIGDKVSAGQALAQLQTQSLSQTLDQDLATLANDQLTLSRALSGQGGGTSSGLGGVGAGGTGGASAGGASGTGTANGASWSAGSNTSGFELLAVHAVTNAQLQQAEQQVLQAQQLIDSARTQLAQDVATATGDCTVTKLSTPTGPATCQMDVQTVSSDQNALNSAVHKLDTAAQNLNALGADFPSSPPSGAGSGSGSSSSAAGRSGSSGASGGSASRSGAGIGTAAPTAADLSADQAAVDAAYINVAVAQQALAQATLTSPIAGTVDAVNIVAGQSVTAASSTANIVVQGSGDYQVSTTIGVDNIPHVAVGQSATVSPDGKHKSLTGKVASISIVPNSTSALSTTYLVVVALHDPTVTLGNASTGTVTIITQHAKSTLAVPTSAVTTSGSANTVEVLTGGTVRQTRVKVGVVGYTWTQITSGLKKGDHVVLANMSQPLPGSATSSSNSGTSNNNTPFRGGIFGTGRGGGGGGAVIVPRGG